MKKGELVVRILSGAGVRTASIGKVESVKKGVVRLFGCDSITWNAISGQEIEPAVPGFHTYLVAFDGGEVEQWIKENLRPDAISIHGR